MTYDKWRVTRLEIRLYEFRTGVNVNLAQERIAGVNESMRASRRNDDDVAGFHLALFISDRDDLGSLRSLL